MKIYVVGDMKYYASFLSDYELTDTLEDADLVMFTGGEDVSPGIYGKREVTTCYTNAHRDLKERHIFNKIRKDQFVVGVCRGSQFLCAMNGGNLVQDCDNHALHNTHPITNGDLVFEITSTHHQMQDPYKLPSANYKVLFWNKRASSLKGDSITMEKLLNKNPEIVLYTVPDKPKCLAIQGHPEMMPDSAVAKYLDKLIHNFVGK